MQRKMGEYSEPQNQQVILKRSLNRSKWTDEEDEKLLEYISKNKPPYSWSDVSQIIEGRTDYQCRRRYCKLTGTKFSS